MIGMYLKYHVSFFLKSGHTSKLELRKTELCSLEYNSTTIVRTSWQLEIERKKGLLYIGNNML